MKNKGSSIVDEGGENVNDFENSCKRNSIKTSSMFYDNHDTIYNILWCCKSNARPSNKTVEGRKALLAKQMDALNKERDIIHMIHSLSSLREQIMSVDQDMNDKFAIINRVTVEERSYSREIAKEEVSKSNFEEEKLPNNVFNSSSMPLITIHAVKNKSNEKVSANMPKKEIKSINEIISNEIKDINSKSKLFLQHNDLKVEGQKYSTDKNINHRKIGKSI